MSDEITFIGDRRGRAVQLGFAVLIGALGAWFLLHDIAWPGLGLLVLTVLWAAFVLPMVIWPQSTYLRLDSRGFEIGSRRRKTRLKWDTVAALRSGEFDDLPVIEVECDDPEQGRVIYRIADLYEASLSDILSELVDWRTRFGPPR